MKIDPELTVQIDTDDPTPMLGYPFAKQLLARKKPFTALFAYNDISAIGAIRAIAGAGTARSAGCFGDGIRRHSGRGVSYSEFDHGATAAEPNGRSGGAESCWSGLRGRKNILLRLRLSRELVVRESTAKANGSG